MTGALVHPAEGGAWAQASGPPMPTPADPPTTLIEAVASRLALWPDGQLWTCDEAGQPRGESYARLWDRSLAIAAGLRAQGVEPGRIVALAAGDALAFTAGYWACLRMGCAILPLASRRRRAGADERLHLLERLGDPLLVADAAFRTLADETGASLGLTVLDLADLERAGAGLPAPPAARRPEGASACFIPTSGSTGRVKLAAMPEAVLIRRRFVRAGPSAGPDNADLVIFDLDTVTGMNVVFPDTPLQVQLPPALVAGRPLVAVEALERHGIARAMLTCSLAGLIADALERSDRTWDLSRLKRVSLGAERVDPFVAGRLAEALALNGAGQVVFRGGYGATETGTLVTGAAIPRVGSAAEAAAPLCLGAPAVGVSLRIVDEAGRRLRPGEVGLVEARAPELVFGGYWGDEAATAAAFTDDGWWRSGDLGVLEDGRLWLHGRAKEMIVVRGRKQALADIDARLQAVLAELGLGDGARVLSSPVQRPGQASEQLALAVFSDPKPSSGHRELLTRALRRTAAMEFGLNPATIVFAAISELPLGPGGKLVRAGLAALAPSPPGPEETSASLDRADGGRLCELWRRVLGVSGPLTPASDFFELGGDSLASEQLFAGIEAEFARRVPPDDFFADPTLATLQALLRRADGGPGRADPDARPWPLPAALREALLVRMETWPGARPTADRLVAGLNTSGTRPPLFWIFQGGEELAALGEALGPDQPLYGFRSGHQAFRYTEDAIQQVALRYVQDILEICPEGPLLLGGNCQGGVIALAAAQHLVRRRRAPSLLVLMEWGFELHPYPGEVLFLHGEDSLQGDPQLRHREPERAWRRLLGGWTVERIPGAHGGYFLGGNVGGLASVLSRHARKALAAPQALASVAAEDARLELRAPPDRMTCSQTLRLSVEVRNLGRAAWAEAEACGLRVGDYWLGAGGVVERWLDARSVLPPLQPGETAIVPLDITAPSRPGRFTLVVDVVEEGSRWLDPLRSRAPSVEVTVEGPAP